MNLEQLLEQVGRRVADEEALRMWEPVDPALWRPWRPSMPPPPRREGWTLRDRLAWCMGRVGVFVRREVGYLCRVVRWWTVRILEGL